jgi:hypothetical protein
MTPGFFSGRPYQPWVETVALAILETIRNIWAQIFLQPVNQKKKMKITSFQPRQAD